MSIITLSICRKYRTKFFTIFPTCTRSHYLLLILTLKTKYWGVKFQLQKTCCENVDQQTFFGLTHRPLCLSGWCWTDAQSWGSSLRHRLPQDRATLAYFESCHMSKTISSTWGAMTRQHSDLLGRKCFFPKEREARGRKNNSFVNSDSRVDWVTVFITLCLPFSISNLS